MNYEELNVFKESHKFVLEIYKITETFPNEEKFRLVDQLIRASYSIPSNIAEGNSRNTTKNYINFLYNARDSANEIKYFLLLSKDLGYISMERYLELKTKIEDIIKMLNEINKFIEKENMMKKEKNTNNLQNPKSNLRHPKSILVTGGAGFIGSNFIHYIFKNAFFGGKIINVDKLTYAGNLENLIEIDNKYGGERYFFEKADICDFDEIKRIFEKYNIDTVVNFAAESHVDRSIYGPKDFVQTNIMGTFTLLEVAREIWKGREDVLFHHISTDEVYGSIEEGKYFYEDIPYRPNSPYSASKASSDHLVRAYHKTYGLPVTVSNCSNNYGPYQFPEKLIPLMILNILEEKALPVYGDGKNVRDWLYVEDHCSAIWEILNNGKVGETYNIGGENEWENIKLVNFLCEKISKIKGKDEDYYKRLITFVKDRPGHDRRYAINCDKIKKELGWQRQYDFEKGLDTTVKWYMNHQDWVDKVRSGEYRKWLEKNYKAR